MAVNKVIYGTTVLVDLSSDTVTEDSMLSGKTAHDKSGTLIVGNVITQQYYTGTSEPEANLGTDGDVYLKTGV